MGDKKALPLRVRGRQGILSQHGEGQKKVETKEIATKEGTVERKKAAATE